MSPRDTPDKGKGKGPNERAKGVPGRGEDDNVTYVNFGKRRRVDTEEETLRDDAHPSQLARPAQPQTPDSPQYVEPDPEFSPESFREAIEKTAVEYHNRQQTRWSKRITSDKPRDSIFNPAAERVMKFVTTTTDSGRLARGRKYARAGHVVDLDLRVGAVHGQVAGSQNQPFSVLIQLPYRDKDDIGKVTGMLARTANSIRRAIRGDVEPEVLDILLAPSADDVKMSCDCPDYGHVCKHVVAVADRLAARIDADPLQLFALRGLNIHALETMVMESAQKVARESAAELSDDLGDEDTTQMPGTSTSDGSADGSNKAEGTSTAASKARAVSNELFWNGRSLPDMPEPKVAPAIDDSDPELLRKAMRAVSHTNVDLLRAVSDVEDLYHFLTEKNN